MFLQSSNEVCVAEHNRRWTAAAQTTVPKQGREPPTGVSASPLKTQTQQTLPPHFLQAAWYDPPGLDKVRTGFRAHSRRIIQEYIYHTYCSRGVRGKSITKGQKHPKQNKQTYKNAFCNSKTSLRKFPWQCPEPWLCQTQPSEQVTPAENIWQAEQSGLGDSTLFVGNMKLHSWGETNKQPSKQTNLRAASFFLFHWAQLRLCHFCFLTQNSIFAVDSTQPLPLEKGKGSTQWCPSAILPSFPFSPQDFSPQGWQGSPSGSLVAAAPPGTWGCSARSWGAPEEPGCSNPMRCFLGGIGRNKKISQSKALDYNRGGRSLKALREHNTSLELSGKGNAHLKMKRPQSREENLS